MVSWQPQAVPQKVNFAQCLGLFIYQASCVRGLEVNSALTTVPRLIQSSKYVSNTMCSLSQAWGWRTKNLELSNRLSYWSDAQQCHMPLLLALSRGQASWHLKTARPGCPHLPWVSSINCGLGFLYLVSGCWAEEIPQVWDLPIISMYWSNHHWRRDTYLCGMVVCSQFLLRKHSFSKNIFLFQDE